MKSAWKQVAAAATLTTVLAAASTAQAQSRTTVNAEPAESKWSADIAFGIDNSISGNINSSGVGRLNDQAVVILKKPYEEVYGTGLHVRFGGGYMLDPVSEVLVTFAFQSADADLTPLGDIGASKLYAQYADYQSFSLDVGFRRYANLSRKVRAYGEASIGVAILDETDVVLIAPSTNLVEHATDFYDKTAALTLGSNAGVVFRAAERIDLYGQLGVRYVGGMSPVDSLVGTGLEKINDNSARWTLPVMLGARFRF